MMLSPMHRNRCAPDAAWFVVLIVIALSWARALPAQDSTQARQPPGYRDPHTAQTLGSFIPGAGHMYAGERVRGLGLMVVSFAGIAEGIASWNDACQVNFSDPDVCQNEPTAGSRFLSITQIAVGVGCWVISAIDAPRAAERENGRLRAARVSLAPLSGSAGRLAGIQARLTISW